YVASAALYSYRHSFPTRRSSDLGDGQQGFGGAGVAVEDDILDLVAQIRRDLVVDFQLPGVDDAHGQARLDRMEQEYRVDRLAHRDRKSTRLNSSHVKISYAVFCL